ncbi:hypothetical protein A3C20_00980 [Candidatus Kaiserbacteria bacterium RIFCSPHIGHO2_02_FULL_55_25]|uniref:Uncharacterized protein n=1 Tax=Candidatus Kaiserbacteria bacterium RIFCSPHIGHO2_02_FULL_55_25 TaxID=1798498 RepID=A0A1F6E551_9BACT|nr:MAG: hypothetical protein A2764_03275 [Candidatus Kaiserbacteria bacterium RIFCSPHIGHO2_01_FULL_55_79]OGG68766.1 MAG: hypothetical protein A3C20_00980 [Candidatus Kaiserbacteria bacterium RIFCSPHIGHO2_02_FULL_55_25]OGG78031.1 MAG: hypothetical protein A3F56_02745 [Candidatus Kaiserbacteria bacterium RIFCSPHIGHO2_12_FULL_55_13]OGG84074.1 MAG: hypothetical protein A3A42_02120 [Candidatus Kaiserbacteria bacterium RIFCSPLOWO2_01_FULL_55_25]
MRSTQATAAAVAEPVTTQTKRVLVVGPEDWTTDDIVFLKDYLHKRGIVAKTFRADEGIEVGHVIEAIANVDAFVLVLGTDQRGWCNRHSGRLSIAAQLATVKFKSMAYVGPVHAADTAQVL